MASQTTIAQDYLAAVGALRGHFDLPRIARIWLPPVRQQPSKSAEFGAVVLDDGSVGLMYMLLDDTLQQIHERYTPEHWAGADPVSVAQGLESDDPVHKVLGLGAANAIAQHAIAVSGLPLDTETNSIASFDPQPGDRLGMIGYFPPLVAKLRAAKVDLTVVELKPELAQREGGFRVTLDAGELRHCNKILSTSTLLLNDSIDRMLAHCGHAEQVALIGPSAGFLPDPLFARGVHTVGGNQVLDCSGFLDQCLREQRWGHTSRKYCLHRDTYPGLDWVLNRGT